VGLLLLVFVEPSGCVLCIECIRRSMTCMVVLLIAVFQRCSPVTTVLALGSPDPEAEREPDAKDEGPSLLSGASAVCSAALCSDEPACAGSCCFTT
jgi:hypothetical protein